MEKATYPQKTCREAVFGRLEQAHTCELVLLHPGPHASLSLPETVEIRDRWEKDHPDWRDNIGQLDDIV